MNKERFHELISRPDMMEDSDLVHLQQVIREFPYFQNAHLLLLYGLYKKRADTFGDQLKQSSLYLSNRSFFVSAIFQGWQNSSLEVVSEQKPAMELEPFVEPITNVPSEEKVSDIIGLTIEEHVKEVVLEVEPSVIPVTESKLMRETEPSSDQEESFTLSFDDSQVIDLTEKKEIEVAGKEETTTDLLELDINVAKEEDGPTEDLIDHFLKVNPRIVPKLELDSRGDISTPWLEENEEIVTETLATIYEQQGHFLKAKEAFQKLILKFPEKSTYFASRIQELEKRIK